MESNGMSKALVTLGLIIAGLIGLYMHIDYSGWILLVALLMAANYID